MLRTRFRPARSRAAPKLAKVGRGELLTLIDFVRYAVSRFTEAKLAFAHGTTDPEAVSPDGQNLDNYYMARPGAHDVQLDLFGDYKSNVALYPTFQNYFRTHQPPFLAVWGKNDPFFLPPGAEAFRRDNPKAVVQFFDTGHFALETHATEIARSIRDFLSR